MISPSQAEFDDPDSVYSFYKRLIALRHDNPVVSAGSWTLIDADDEHAYAFLRELDGERLLTIVNLSGRTIDLPAESAALTDAADALADRILIANYDDATIAATIGRHELAPWQAAVIRL